MIRLISQWDFRTALRTAHDAYNNVLDGQVPNEYRIIQMQMFSDMPFVLCTAVFIYFLRKFLSNNIFTSLADYWNVPKSKRQRFIENAWFSLYYSLMVAMSMYALWDTPWLWDFEQIYKGFPNEHLIDDDIYPMTKIYRLIAFAFYSQALFTLVYVDERMKDFGEMLMHHITTLALMIVSNVTGIHRLGSMIVLIHDIGDVFLYSAKAFHEADKQIPANVSFFLFTVTFLPLRLIYLPYTVIHFILTPVRTLFPGLNYIFGRVHNAAWPVEISNYGLCLNRYCLSTMWFLGFAMLVLFCLHCYWFKLTLNVLVKALSHGGNVQGDPRHKDYTDKKKRESARSQS